MIWETNKRTYKLGSVNPDFGCVIFYPNKCGVGNVA